MTEKDILLRIRRNQFTRNKQDMDQIITHHANNRTFIIVEVEVDSRYHNIQYRLDGTILQMLAYGDKCVEIHLLMGEEYKIHCIAEEATEEQAKDVVEKATKRDPCMYKCYSDEGGNSYIALTALHSLIRHHYPETFITHKHVIIEKI